MGGRMAAWYAGSAAVLLVLGTTSLYLTIAASLDAEVDAWLGYSTEYLGKDQPRTGKLPDKDELGGDDFRIRDEDGHILFETPAAADRIPSVLVPGAAGVEYRTAAGRWVRALSRRVGGRTYEVASDRTHELGLLALYRRYMLVVMIMGVAVSSVVGIVLIRRGLRPLKEIAATAHRIGPKELGERIAVEELPAELADLGRTFNVMLDRLQGSFGRLVRFSGDIAHELRTPVHAIRNVSEVALATSRTREEDREALAACLESAAGLSRLIERLLFLARADDPRTVLELEAFEMGGELEAIREFYEPSATEAGVDLVVDAPDCLVCRLDRTLFQRAIGNLLTNALTHTPAGGRVTVTASVEGKTLFVSVSDTGIGVAEEHLPHLFDRFYRPDRARTAGQGVGLGLSIVKSIVELHRGRPSVASRPGEGTVVTMHFPAYGDDETVISA
ncbi:heavy metal sensor kinase [Singulisphaera acidiphila DSM 18658]|uniref:histidine kinase n=2 Tax=Singulisphaera acidiphila TaxID=466153 RepID=L0DPR1_SINAD|nr:heavy metal sensor kinase [Singulisphaera acidiphila DSM 18658]